MYRGLPRAFGVGLALAAVAAACSGSAAGRVTVRLQDGPRALLIRAEVAATPEARAGGLMGRTGLGAGEGMLFLFPGSAPREFWMRDTLIPLDIAFIDRGVVVDVATLEPCRSARPEDCARTRSAAPADSALEVPAGTLAKAGIRVGAHVMIVGKTQTPR